MSSYEAEEALAQLRHHWGSAYVIEQTGPRTWLAARRDGQGMVHANDPDSMFRAITEDYLARPVPREGGPLEQYDRQQHLVWYERTHPDAENWPPYPRTDAEAAVYVAQYSGAGGAGQS